MNSTIIVGDCREQLRTLVDASIDSVVTDPPYEISFMCKSWDGTGIAYSVELWREVLRVLKPGGHLLAFGGTRTYHRMACAIEDAGFEIRDSLHWVYGTGFPKSLNLGDGRGTALKPAHEPIVLARRPLAGTVAANVQAHGTGALNIDACRIGISKDVPASPRRAPQNAAFGDLSNDPGTGSGWDRNIGRWPANFLLSHGEDCGDSCVPGCPVAELDAQSGTSPSNRRPSKGGAGLGYNGGGTRPSLSCGHSDSGGASRFFYVSKPSRRERDAGCQHLPPRSAGEATDREEGSDGLSSPRAGAGRTGGARNYHPTVKPVALMRYLIRLVTPPGGAVLDPFVGSGTTGIAAALEKCHFVGVEQSSEYAEIARSRISHWADSAEEETP